MEPFFFPMDPILEKLDVIVKLFVVMNERVRWRGRESIEQGRYHSCVTGDETEAQVLAMCLS